MLNRLYQQAYEKLYFPVFEDVIKRRETCAFYRRSLESQWFPRPVLEAQRKEQLAVLLDHAYRYCPYYRDLLEDAGFSPQRGLDDTQFSGLPLLTKAVIRENFPRLVSSAHRGTLWAKATGGSTGDPLQFGITKLSYSWRMAMSKRGYSWAGARPGTKQAYIWGLPLDPVPPFRKLKEYMQRHLDRQLYFNCFDFSEEQMHSCLQQLNSYKPSVVIGYTNPLYHLALYIEQTGKVTFSPKGVISAAEPLQYFQRETLERVFGCKVFNTYGAREFMLIGAECERHEGLHLSAENLYVEVLKEDGTPAGDGEMGRVVVTDLHNFGMPFIRYEIGDLAVACGRSCSCGRGLPLVSQVVGRSLDMIRLPDNKLVPGEFFPHMFKDYPEISRFQVVQERLDHIVVKIVPLSELSQVRLQALEKQIRLAVGGSMRLDFSFCDRIPLNATGKHRVTISRIHGGTHD